MADEDILVDGRPLSSLKVTELKEELENRQLSTKGVKAVLQERLREALAAQGDDPVVDEQNPIVAGYLARQSAALAEARKRTESEASGTTTPQSEVSPSKQSEASPRKGRTPRKEKKDVEPEAEPEADIAPEPEKVAIVEKPEPKPEPITETEASPSKASEKDAAVEVSVEKVDAETAQESDSPQEAEKEKTEPQVELENGGQEEDEPDRDESIEKQPEKEDDGDELDYGDDEEKEQKDDESMDAEDAKEEKVVQIEKEKKEDKDDGVKKEEKVREVSRRRVSSPSSRHPVSNVVHIRGLTRPFTEGQLRAEIQKNCGEIVDLWMDKVKSHCFVKLNSDADAGNVISAMNNVVWPDGNPKRLSIVYDTEDNLIKHRNGLEATIAEPAKIGGGRADRLSTTSQSSILGGKTNFQITMQNVLRDNDKLDSERKRERGSIQSRLTRIENKDQVKDEKKDEKKEDRKRKRSETPPFSRGAGFMDEKKARNEERERRREGPRSEERRKVVVEEEEAPKKSLDQLFKKTVALPPIYYLPLTEEQIAAKEAEKSAKGKERAETTSDRDRPHRVDRNDRGDRPRHRD